MHVVKSKIMLKGAKSLILLPELITIVGRSPALLLHQIHFWIENQSVKGKIHEGKKWVANSCESWSEDLKSAMSRSTVVRSIKKLKDLEVVRVEKLSDYKNNRTNWYTINYERVDELLAAEMNITSTDATELKKQASMPECQPKSTTLSRRAAQNEQMYIDKITNKDNIIYLNKSDKSKIADLNLARSEKPLSQQMLDIWNEIIDPEVKSELSKGRCRLLIAALKYKFQNNLQKWKEYCLQIASSDYLMGKIKSGFKIVLDTALKFDFIQRIFEKQFGVKNLTVVVETSDAVMNEIERGEDSPEIKEIKRKINEKVGHTTYISWFKNVKIAQTLEAVEIVVKTMFHKDWIKKNHLADIEAILGMKTVVLVR